MPIPRPAQQSSRRLLRTIFGIGLLGTILIGSAIPAAAAGDPYLVKNINLNGSSAPEQLTALGDLVMFTADDGVHGRELWKSDGTAAGTQLVKDIDPTPNNYFGPWSLTAINGLLYFSADDGVHGQELWVSDGTSAGTQLIDIQPGQFGSDPFGFTEYNGLTYFSAWTATTSTELWVSAGTPASTHLVQDIAPGTARSNPMELTVAGGKLYFLRVTYKNGWDHAVLYRTNGSPTGAVQVKDRQGNKVRGFKIHYTHALWNVDDTLYFTVTRKDLWVSRGTRASTRKIADFGTRRIANVDGTAIVDWFDSNNFPAESSLWRSNGTAAGTLPLHLGGAGVHGASYADSWLMSLGSKAVFWAEDGMSVTNGTDAGTQLLGVPVWPGDDNNYSEVMTMHQGVLYFDGRTYDEEWNISGPSIWRTDGTTAGTYPVTATYPHGLVDDLTSVGNSLYFVNALGKGAELYRYVP